LVSFASAGACATAWTERPRFWAPSLADLARKADRLSAAGLLRRTQEEVWCGLELVHDDSISSKPRRQGCRYDSSKEFREGKTIADALQRFMEADGLVMLFPCSLLDVRSAVRSLSLQNGYKFLAIISPEACCRAISSGHVAPGLRQEHQRHSEIREMVALPSEQIWRKPHTSAKYVKSARSLLV
jgi:hypothetical protein